MLDEGLPKESREAARAHLEAQASYLAMKQRCSEFKGLREEMEAMSRSAHASAHRTKDLRTPR